MKLLDAATEKRLARLDRLEAMLVVVGEDGDAVIGGVLVEWQDFDQLPKPLQERLFGTRALPTVKEVLDALEAQ